jgi:hypothetical protein
MHASSKKKQMHYASVSASLACPWTFEHDFSPLRTDAGGGNDNTLVVN